ncbi:MAG: molybdopterin-synthase adenylyltransferase MoeB [Paracoccaceae bacterium]|nr:molybdopterin-synthase adenylyltransferase MoeB [Paracoccaceae bacterium]
MLLVLALAAALWGMGVLMRSSRKARLASVGVLFLAVIVEHLVLPPGHPLREATGGSAQVWVVILGAVALVLGYRQLLRRLRARAHPAQALAAPPAPPPQQDGPFTPAEIDRYARHIFLREIGGPGQRALKQARVLVIGAGGLGAPSLLYLAAAGVGTIGVIDDDVVDTTNLQRQVIHTEARVGMAKVLSAKAQMGALNPHVTVEPHQARLTEEGAAELFARHDLILDGSDNFDTRYLANRIAVATGKPLISAAITQWEGQISLFDPAHGTPCYECIFPTRPAPGLVPTCAEAGVVGPLPGVMGSMMALEAIKQITGAGQTLAGQMLIYDGLWGETRKLTLSRRADCPVCGGVHA